MVVKHFLCEERNKVHMRRLNPKPLKQNNFLPYGDVISWRDHPPGIPINHGFGERLHDLANVDIGTQDGKALISIIKAKCQPQPHTVRLMERHPLGSQAFIPLSANPFLLIVAPPGDFDPNLVEVFITNGYQGINYGRGVWHHFCMPVSADTDFLIVDRGGEGHNCDEIELTASQRFIVNV